MQELLEHYNLVDQRLQALIIITKLKQLLNDIEDETMFQAINTCIYQYEFARHELKRQIIKLGVRPVFNDTRLFEDGWINLD